MKLNFPYIAHALGALLVAEGIFMLIPFLYALHLGESSVGAFYSSMLYALVVGAALWITTYRRVSTRTKKRDIFFLVSVGWVVVTAVGVLPFVLSGAIPSFTNAFFETTSGFTATGATLIQNIDSLEKSVLLWRSITQWMGGMGVIVLVIAILPLVGSSGMQLFAAEAPGVFTDKLHPRIRDTAKKLWLVYIALTILAAAAYALAGMGLFDAINHALTTISTAGYSTHSASIGFFDSATIEYVAIAFMFLAGTNFALLYYLFLGRLGRFRRNTEFKYYVAIIAGATLFIAGGLAVSQGGSLEVAFRTALFHVVSIMTTTGYTTADYQLWPTYLTFIIFALMFIGGMAGSTSGGIKVMRHVVLFRNSLLEFKRQLFSNAILPIRLNGVSISENVTSRIVAFIIIYILLCILSVFIMLVLGNDPLTSVGATAATLGNVGPGIGGVGPAETYIGLSAASKYFLAALMFIGRLELFTVLILFTPYFWRRG
jgi:trk system potassium uptake protein TrkH